MLRANLGFKGEAGSDGVSPIITTSKTDGVTTITIVDAEGTKTATIEDGEISTDMIVDDLTHTDTDKPLSAKQGKVLNDSITSLSTTVGGKVATADIVDALDSTSTTKPLSANQGKTLKTAVDNCYTKTETNTLLTNKPDIYSGTTDPSSSLGEDGDIYLKYSA